MPGWQDYGQAAEVARRIHYLMDELGDRQRAELKRLKRENNKLRRYKRRRAKRAALRAARRRD